MSRFLLAVLALILIPIQPSAQVITSISYGITVTVLNTSSTGAVTGSTFAMNAQNASVFTLTITANGAALSTVLQASNDNTNWFDITTCTTATGCVYNSGVVAFKFIRVNQVTRTGGTSTTASVFSTRAFSGSSSGTVGTNISGNLLFSPDATWSIGLVSSLRPIDVFVANRMLAGQTVQAGAGFGIQWAGRSVMVSTSNGQWQVTNAATTQGVELNIVGPPTLNSCAGATVVAGSRNSAGRVDTTTATCVLNFSQAFTNAPLCTMNNLTANRGNISATTTTTITFSNLTAGDNVTWICMGRIGT